MKRNFLEPLCSLTIHLKIYTGAPLIGNPILGTQYTISCNLEMCGVERESDRMIQEPAVFGSSGAAHG